ncbi:protein enhanced disease resistance 4 [Quercus suber]|uniref:Protein enhanced disease resistance 4 n=1 Tax=Quercus suber TaxID=58331 RepID=A0AAW0KVK6_QUESU
MAEITAKLRLVRCPKCENLLPELADYSVYQCGGCGAVLGEICTKRKLYFQLEDIKNAHGDALGKINMVVSSPGKRFPKIQ